MQYEFVILVISCMVVALCAFPQPMRAQGLEPIQLLEPETEGGKPLMQVLQERKTSRAFSRREIPLQTLSNLLWAAFGINRPESGKRTAPSANNWQEFDIYVAMEKGVYLYDAQENLLRPIMPGNIHTLTGKQDYVKDAPINLIFVADYTRMGNASAQAKDFYSACDVGFISQNVYLFCTSEGLATVVRGWLDKDKLAKKMQLKAEQKIILCQTVGYPAE